LGVMALTSLPELSHYTFPNQVKRGPFAERLEFAFSQLGISPWAWQPVSALDFPETCHLRPDPL